MCLHNQVYQVIHNGSLWNRGERIRWGWGVWYMNLKNVWMKTWQNWWTMSMNIFKKLNRFWYKLRVSYLAHHNQTVTSKRQKLSKAAKEINHEEGVFNKTNRWFLIWKHGVPKDDIFEVPKEKYCHQKFYIQENCPSEMKEKLRHLPVNKTWENLLLSDLP